MIPQGKTVSDSIDIENKASVGVGNIIWRYLSSEVHTLNIINYLSKRCKITNISKSKIKKDFFLLTL